MPALSLIFGLFVVVNVAISQFFPALYFKSLENEKATAVSYLKHIESLPQFQSQLALYTNLYGRSVKEGVYYNDSMREKYIKELQEYQLQNPQARDINYELSLLYAQKGDTQKSKEYLDKARAVDPAI